MWIRPYNSNLRNAIKIFYDTIQFLILIFLCSADLFYKGFCEIKEYDKVKDKIEDFFILGWVLIALLLSFITADLLKIIGSALYDVYEWYFNRKKN